MERRGNASHYVGYSKKKELENFLFAKKISVCCIQDTHLKSKKILKIRGYKCIRFNSLHRRNGRVPIIVKNNIPAYLIKSNTRGAEFQQPQLKAINMELELFNYYRPNDRPLNLSSVQVATTKFIADKDFNGHSQTWGYNQLDQRGEDIES